jgi:hypothetical protein
MNRVAGNHHIRLGIAQHGGQRFTELAHRANLPAEQRRIVKDGEYPRPNRRHISDQALIGLLQKRVERAVGGLEEVERRERAFFAFSAFVASLRLTMRCEYLGIMMIISPEHGWVSFPGLNANIPATEMPRLAATIVFFLALLLGCPDYLLMSARGKVMFGLAKPKLHRLWARPVRCRMSCITWSKSWRRQKPGAHEKITGRRPCSCGSQCQAAGWPGLDRAWQSTGRGAKSGLVVNKR